MALPPKPFRVVIIEADNRSDHNQLRVVFMRGDLIIDETCHTSITEALRLRIRDHIFQPVKDKPPL